MFKVTIKNLSKMTKPSKINLIPFYSENDIYGEFSNFYWAPGNYNILNIDNNPKYPKQVFCQNSEKAIMITKAVMMDDESTFQKLLQTSSPSYCKKLGREVQNFNQEKWSSNLEQIAFSILYDKFNSNQNLKKLLLETNNSILVEASKHDTIWGIGIDIRNKDIYDQTKWKGSNILGNTLMKVRDILKNNEKVV